MAIHIRRRRGLPRLDSRKLQRRAARLARLLGLEGKEISVLLTDDREMTELNRTYLGRNRSTDVLAFSQLEGVRGGLHPEVLGDVVISVLAAGRQARQRRSDLLEELTLLVVHGVLHLLGRDHERVGRRRAAAMLREQRKLVAILRGKQQP